MKVSSSTSRTAQSGAVLLFALLILLMMAIASLSLVRATMTASLVADNVALQESAQAAAQRGVEAAIEWLQAQGDAALWTDRAGYSATRQDPAATQSWEAQWPKLRGAGRVTDVAWSDADPDRARNDVSYNIQRLCSAAGAPGAANCERAPVARDADDSSKGAGAINLAARSPVYFRITVRAAGAHNALSFAQAIVAM
jgi:type IV pilus assembly protein PilX